MKYLVQPFVSESALSSNDGDFLLCSENDSTGNLCNVYGNEGNDRDTLLGGTNVSGENIDLEKPSCGVQIICFVNRNRAVDVDDADVNLSDGYVGGIYEASPGALEAYDVNAFSQEAYDVNARAIDQMFEQQMPVL